MEARETPERREEAAEAEVRDDSTRDMGSESVDSTDGRGGRGFASAEAIWAGLTEDTVPPEPELEAALPLVLRSRAIAVRLLLGGRVLARTVASLPRLS